MRVIQSSSNPRIQRARKILKGKDEHLFIIEGKKLFEEAIRSDILIDEVFVTDETSKVHADLLTKLIRKDIPVNLISTRLAALISDLESSPGLLGIAKKPPASNDLFSAVAAFLISIRDPGNFGAILRTAEAAGCEIIFYSSDCADPFQPKVVRSSMGSVFRMRVAEVNNPKSFLERLRERKVAIYGLTAEGGKSLPDWNPAVPLVVCVGSESHGLPQDLRLTEKISIPMKGAVESLNAAVAASLCLYWIFLKVLKQ